MTSNGQLLNMSDQDRAEKIKELPMISKIKLAHIATLGAVRLIGKAYEHLEKGNLRFYNEQLSQAKELTALAAELTNTDDELVKKIRTHEEVVEILKTEALTSPEEGWLSDLSLYTLRFNEENKSIEAGFVGSIDIGHLASVITEIINKD